MGTKAKTMRSDKVDAIASRIIEYLHQNPEAADTVEGVAQWWLSGASSHSDVVEALRYLQTGGIVVRAVPRGGRTGIWHLSDSGKGKKYVAQQALPPDAAPRRPPLR